MSILAVLQPKTSTQPCRCCHHELYTHEDHPGQQCSAKIFDRRDWEFRPCPCAGFRTLRWYHRPFYLGPVDWQ